jgi:glycosyltransferase involved in cell wall biosynthesis
MIPTYNCARFLRQSLEGVLSSDPGEDMMQIEVVDDRSTQDDPEEIVNSFGGRVAFYRKPVNEGATRNFNTCLQRSRGELVHVLHGDDWILPGFYERILEAASRYPNLALYAARSFITEEDGCYIHMTDRLRSLESPCKNTREFEIATPIQCSGVVMRRSFYEQTGGFLEELVHTADWEMWSRGFQFGGGILLPEVLSAYRTFPENDTTRLMRTGENLRDITRMINILEKRIIAYDKKKAWRFIILKARDQADTFRKKGDLEAEAAALTFISSNISIAEKLHLGLFRGAQRMQSRLSFGRSLL